MVGRRQRLLTEHVPADRQTEQRRDGEARARAGIGSPDAGGERGDQRGDRVSLDRGGHAPVGGRRRTQAAQDDSVVAGLPELEPAGHRLGARQLERGSSARPPRRHVKGAQHHLGLARKAPSQVGGGDACQAREVGVGDLLVRPSQQRFTHHRDDRVADLVVTCRIHRAHDCACDLHDAPSLQRR